MTIIEEEDLSWVNGLAASGRNQWLDGRMEMVSDESASRAVEGDDGFCRRVT
jgi:hypothetical protein